MFLVSLHRRLFLLWDSIELQKFAIIMTISLLSNTFFFLWLLLRLSLCL